MLKTLVKVGDQLAIVLDPEILKQLQAEEDTTFEVTADGQTLVLTKIPVDADRQTFRDAVGEVNRQYGDVLKKLAE